jgi:hypothetical protein
LTGLSNWGNSRGRIPGVVSLPLSFSVLADRPAGYMGE